MWEQINSFYLMMNDPGAATRAAESPYDFFSQTKQSSQSFVGITDLTLSHGEAWNFCRIGRLLERTDKITRLLDVKYFLLKTSNAEAVHDAARDGMQWSAVLKSASALEMFRKKHRKIAPEGVVDFLLLDREFPRSALYCLNTADDALHNVTGNAARVVQIFSGKRIGTALRGDVLCGCARYSGSGIASVPGQFPDQIERHRRRDSRHVLLIEGADDVTIANARRAIADASHEVSTAETANGNGF